LTIGTAGVQSAGADGKLFQPTDVVTAPNGDIFITEGHVIGSGINRVSKWSKDGKFLGEGRGGRTPAMTMHRLHPRPQGCPQQRAVSASVGYRAIDTGDRSSSTRSPCPSEP
jgi:hypothetical protein